MIRVYGFAAVRFKVYLLVLSREQREYYPYVIPPKCMPAFVFLGRE